MSPQSRRILRVSAETIAAELGGRTWTLDAFNVTAAFQGRAVEVTLELHPTGERPQRLTHLFRAESDDEIRATLLELYDRLHARSVAASQRRALG